ncbi:hypothetical protein ACWE42_07540 [Sutcliffiella cohnii]
MIKPGDTVFNKETGQTGVIKKEGILYYVEGVSYGNHWRTMPDKLTNVLKDWKRSKPLEETDDLPF